MTDLTLSLTTEDRLALRRFISEHRQLSGTEYSLEEAALMLLRDALTMQGILAVDLDEDDEVDRRRRLIQHEPDA